MLDVQVAWCISMLLTRLHNTLISVLLLDTEGKIIFLQCLGARVTEHPRKEEQGMKRGN